MKKCFLAWLTIMMLSVCLPVYAESLYEERVDFGARLEPKGNAILHGAGQNPQEFGQYTQAVGMAPAIYMGYASIHHDYQKSLDKIQNAMASFDTPPVALQLGMHMNEDENPDKTYYHDIAQGLRDEGIIQYLKAVETLDMPVYLRIGFEFNGEWNGYADAEVYVRAFQRIVDLMRAEKIGNIATVWCMNPDGNRKDFMSYYPGDDYVDWWALDVFRIASTWDDITLDFLAEAENRQKPVMLTECTPYEYNTGKRGVVDGWFMHYFRFIQENPVIKGVCYINRNWTESLEKWHHWGDARLETAHSKVLEAYLVDMTDPIWLNAISPDVLGQYLHGMNE